MIDSIVDPNTGKIVGYCFDQNLMHDLLIADYHIYSTDYNNAIQFLRIAQIFEEINGGRNP